MPLGDDSPFGDWIRRDRPPYTVGRLVENWIALAAEQPWAYPSTPLEEYSHPSTRQVRSVTVPGTDVQVIYAENVDPDGVGTVDLIWVGTPDGAAEG
jgi:hypothetical protein